MILTLNMQESGNVYLSFLAAMKHKKYSIINPSWRILPYGFTII